jgi:hypothetical protein
VDEHLTMAEQLLAPMKKCGVAGCINAVRLKDRLRDIQADGRN